MPSEGRNPRQLKVLDFSSLSEAASLPPAGRNSRKLKVLDFSSLSKWRRCLRRVQILKNWRSSIFKATCPGQLRCLGQVCFSKIGLFVGTSHLSRAASLPGAELFLKHGLSGILGLLCAEKDVGNIKKCTVRNSGTPVCRTRRRKYQHMHFQEFWDSCAQNKTSENVRNLKKYTVKNYGTPVHRTKRQKSQKMHSQEFWDSCAQNKTSEVS